MVSVLFTVTWKAVFYINISINGVEYMMIARDELSWTYPFTSLLWHEARIRATGQGLAWRREAALHDGVVFGVEVKLQQIANGGSDAFRFED